MKHFIINIIACCLIIGTNLFITISVIEKHSVHPIYGNYIKNDCNGENCKPWDYCPDPGVCK
jgi:hypothetical protein